jgi:hypothetical protein
MRRTAVWLVTLPPALTGVEAAHALANQLFGSPQGEAEVFASAASGAELGPPLLALALAALLLALAARAAGRWWLPRSAGSLALPFACVPPLAFVLLELLEAVLGDGSMPWDPDARRTFAAGLALQLPFALAGYLLARLLLRLSDGARGLIARMPSRLSRPPLVLPPTPGDRAPRPDRGPCVHAGRGPPASLFTSG